MFGRATITLGIGPHSSVVMLSCVLELAPPPSYSSVFKRVKASRQQSTSKTEFYRSLPSTVCTGTGMLPASDNSSTLFHRQLLKKAGVFLVKR